MSNLIRFMRGVRIQAAHFQPERLRWRSLDKTKLLPGRVMVLLVCSGALLSFLGIYQPFVNFAGAGATVPLLGFGHTLWKGMQKAISEDGFLGLFTGGFTACALGVSAALIFSYLSSMIFHPQMKD